MGRFLDEALLQRLAKIVQTPVTAYRLDAETLPDDVAMARQALSSHGDTFARALDARRLVSYLLLDDVYGQPALILKFEKPRTLYAQTQASIRYTLLSLLAGALIFSVVAFVFLERLVVSPLARLSVAMRRIGREADFSARVTATGSVEVVALSVAINSMLARLDETQRRLKEALQAKEEMIQNVSHELRTPLTQIIGYTDLLLDGALDGELLPDHRAALMVIREQARLLASLVDTLLTLQTLTPGALEKRPIPMAALVSRILAGWQSQAEARGIALHSDLSPDLPPVQGDARFLEQSINQVLDNAFKFTQPGGTVTVCLAREGEQVHLSVADTGIGIPADKLDKIFDRFYQVDGSSTRRYRGMGIGLALVREVAALHGGRVWATSDGEGQGATLHITLPIAATGPAIHSPLGR